MLRNTIIIYFVFLLVLSGCAVTPIEDPRPTYEEISYKIPIPSTTESRLIFFNAFRTGMAPAPNIEIDGEHVGNASLGSLFVIDLPSGSHQIRSVLSAFDFAPDVQTMSLAPGETCYLQVVPEIIKVLPEYAEIAIANLKYDGYQSKSLIPITSDTISAGPVTDTSEVTSTLPSLDSNDGRIVFYNNSRWVGVMNLINYFSIELNGEKVGRLFQSGGSYFYVDRPKGTYTLIADLWPSSYGPAEPITFDLSPGEIKYINVISDKTLVVVHLDTWRNDVSELEFKGEQ